MMPWVLMVQGQSDVTWISCEETYETYPGTNGVIEVNSASTWAACFTTSFSGLVWVLTVAISRGLVAENVPAVVDANDVATIYHRQGSARTQIALDQMNRTEPKREQ